MSKSMDTKALTTNPSPEEKLSQLGTDADPIMVKARAIKRLEGAKEGESFSADDTDLIRAMTLNEFDNGVLLAACTSQTSRTFAIDLMRKIQREYLCEKSSEKATAEMAAASYVRALDVQRVFNNFLSKESYGDLSIKVISVLGKELDRANRHYLTAIQTLRSLKQPPMQLNIKATTAVVGQNQIVQANNETK